MAHRANNHEDMKKLMMGEGARRKAWSPEGEYHRADRIGDPSGEEKPHRPCPQALPDPGNCEEREPAHRVLESDRELDRYAWQDELQRNPDGGDCPDDGQENDS